MSKNALSFGCHDLMRKQIRPVGKATLRPLHLAVERRHLVAHIRAALRSCGGAQASRGLKSPSKIDRAAQERTTVLFENGRADDGRESARL